MTLWNRYITWSAGRDAALGVSDREAAWLAATPAALTALYLILLVLPFSHYAALRLLNENGPVENLTFAAALAASIVALRTALRSARRGEPAYVREIAAVACEVRNCTPETLSAQTCATARGFFRNLS